LDFQSVADPTTFVLVSLGSVTIAALAAALLYFVTHRSKPQ